MKKGSIKRECIFFIALVIIAIVSVILIINGKNNKEIVEQSTNLEAQVNPDALPETNPSIGGTDNVESINGEKVNTSSKLKETKKVDIYTFDNIKMSKGERGTIITATLTSTATKKVNGKSAVMKFFDKSGKLVSQMNTYIPQVKPGESIMFRTETTSDVANAYDFTIELK